MSICRRKVHIRGSQAIHIDVLFTDHALTPQSRSGQTVIVIDVLRATSTIVTALHHGARAVYPVAEVDQARALARHMPQALLGGEREGVPCEGFHMGNSPLEYTADQVKRRDVILTTTNGTNALQKAVHSGAAAIGTGTLLHASTTAAWCLQQNNSVTLVCAGTHGHFGLEDALGAGCIIEHCVQQHQSVQLSDAASVALLIWQRYASNALEALNASAHGQRLLRMDFSRDVAYCAKVNILHHAVVWQHDRLVLHPA